MESNIEAGVSLVHRSIDLNGETINDELYIKNESIHTISKNRFIGGDENKGGKSLLNNHIDYLESVTDRNNYRTVTNHNDYRTIDLNGETTNQEVSGQHLASNVMGGKSSVRILFSDDALLKKCCSTSFNLDEDSKKMNDRRSYCGWSGSRSH